VDDIADEPGEPEVKRLQLAEWRDELDRLYAGKPVHPVAVALTGPVAQFGLPKEDFLAVIDGCEMDGRNEMVRPSMANLELYCDRVASAVGRLSVRVFGEMRPRSLDVANATGMALQLTNILRDVRTDADRGRIYLPETELKRFRVTPEELLRGGYSTRFVELASSVAERASHFYRLAAKTLPSTERRSMAAAELMGAVYWRLLRKLEHRRFNVFGPAPARLTKLQKLMLVMRTGCRIAVGAMTPNYGV
jgi:phytoene synthase